MLAGAKIVGDSGGRTENRILDRFRSPHRLAIGGAQVLQRGPRARRHDRVLVHPLQNGIALQQPPQAIYDGLVVSKQADTRGGADSRGAVDRSEEHTSELQSLMRISYAVFCLKKKNNKK